MHVAHRAAAWPLWPAMEPAHFAYIGRTPHEAEAEAEPLVAGASFVKAKAKA